MKNEFAIREEKEKNGTRYLFVDTSKAILRNMRWEELGDWGKRKFENLLVLGRFNEKKEYVKVVYL